MKCSHMQIWHLGLVEIFRGVVILPGSKMKNKMWPHYEKASICNVRSYGHSLTSPLIHKLDYSNFWQNSCRHWSL